MKSKVIILDNKDKYLIVNKLKSHEHLFYQIIKINGDDDFILVEEINGEYFLINNEDLAKMILSEMYKNISNK